MIANRPGAVSGGTRSPLLAALAFYGGTAALLTVGCKVGPDYEPPQPVMPDAWHGAAVDGLVAGEAVLQTWWTTLEDPVLDELIQRAGAGNLDLEAAFLRIKQARAVRGIATGERFPDVDATGSARRSRTSEGTVSQLPPEISRTDNFYDAGASATWEVDLWGRISRSIEAADAGLDATVEDYRDVLVVLYAQIGLNYVQLRSLQERIRYVTENIAGQRGTLDLTRNRFDAGIAPELDVRQAELNLANTESTLPTLRQLLARTVHRLGVLLGEHPSALYDLLGVAEAIPEPPTTVAIGIPADVLRQRPDVRRAERLLAAQTAEIGIATAGLYPTFALDGFFGYEATDDVFDAENESWFLGPIVRWNLFDGGRVRNSIELEGAEAEEAMILYEQTVLFALEDVENALVDYAQEIERRRALERSVTAALSSVELVRTLYRTGLSDFQNVLDTERFLFVQQDQLAASQGQVVQNLILLYQALGGGWQPDPAVLRQELEDQEEEGEPIL